MINFKVENVDNLEEAKYTEFGFVGDSGVIRNKDNNVVGFYTINVDEPEIHLQELEIVQEYQNNGYGTAFINALFEKYSDVTTIIGTSTETSVEFYLNLGADFSDSCAKCTDKDCHCHQNYEKNKNDNDENFLDTCDEYSENEFIIYRH